MRATTNPVFRRSQGYTPVLFFALFWTLKPGSALRGMYYPTTWCALLFFRIPLEKIAIILHIPKDVLKPKHEVQPRVMAA